MKIVLLFTLFFISFFSISQSRQDSEAEFPGGYNEFMKYIQHKLEIPSDFTGSGKVAVRFLISENGEVKNVQLRRGMEDCEKCNESAIKVIENMPNWKPAFSSEKQKNIETHYIIPIKFEKATKEK